MIIRARKPVVAAPVTAVVGSFITAPPPLSLSPLSLSPPLPSLSPPLSLPPPSLPPSAPLSLSLSDVADNHLGAAASSCLPGDSRCRICCYSHPPPPLPLLSLSLFFSSPPLSLSPPSLFLSLPSLSLSLFRDTDQLLGVMPDGGTVEGLNLPTLALPENPGGKAVTSGLPVIPPAEATAVNEQGKWGRCGLAESSSSMKE